MSVVLATPVVENDKDFLYPCFGLCCCVISVDTNFPSCLGSATSLTLCCSAIDVVCCKPSVHPGTFCVCFKLDAELIPFGVCIKSKSSICCIDSRISLPPDDSVPCTLIFMFWTCFALNSMSCQCCSSLTQIQTISAKAM